MIHSAIGRVNLVLGLIISVMLGIGGLLTACSTKAPTPVPAPKPTSRANRLTPTIVPNALGPAVVGRIAPDFTLNTDHGQTINLRNFRGYPLLLNFWASWCGPCRSEMPDLQRIHAEYRGQGLIILGINEEEAQDVVTRFRNEYGLDFILLLDVSGEVNNLYGFRSLPTSVFVDSAGTIKEIRVGSMKYAEFQRLLASSFGLKPQADAQPFVSSTPTIEGCAVDALNIRTGPGTNHSISGGLKQGECRLFDGRNADASWLRLSKERGVSGQRLWVSAQYINLKGSINALPVAR